MRASTNSRFVRSVLGHRYEKSYWYRCSRFVACETRDASHRIGSQERRFSRAIELREQDGSHKVRSSRKELSSKEDEVQNTKPVARDDNTTWDRFPKIPLKTKDDIALFLKEASWDVSALLKPRPVSDSQPLQQVSAEQVQHIQRLSALRSPKDKAENEATRRDLEAQLNFVRAVQDVDTTDVEPLVAIRDETESAMTQNKISLSSVSHVFDGEERVGRYRRIVPKKLAESEPQPQSKGNPDWDPLSRARLKVGRYIMVNTKES